MIKNLLLILSFLFSATFCFAAENLTDCVFNGLISNCISCGVKRGVTCSYWENKTDSSGVSKRCEKVVAAMIGVNDIIGAMIDLRLRAVQSNDSRVSIPSDFKLNQKNIEEYAPNLNLRASSCSNLAKDLVKDPSALATVKKCYMMFDLQEDKLDIGVEVIKDNCGFDVKNIKMPDGKTADLLDCNGELRKTQLTSDPCVGDMQCGAVQINGVKHSAVSIKFESLKCFVPYKRLCGIDYSFQECVEDLNKNNSSNLKTPIDAIQKDPHGIQK